MAEQSGKFSLIEKAAILVIILIAIYVAEWAQPAHELWGWVKGLFTKA